MNKTIVKTSLVVLASFLVCPSAFAAETADTAIQAIKDSTLSISVDTDDLVINIEGNTLNTGTIVVSAATNSAKGYTVSVSANTDHTDLRHTTISSQKIEAVSDNTAANAFQPATWGLSTDASIYNPATLSERNIFKTEVNGSNNHNVTIGIQPAGDLAMGQYQNSLTFTAVTNSLPGGTFPEAFEEEDIVPIPIPTDPNVNPDPSPSDPETKNGGNIANGGTYYAMQDMTPEVCALVSAYEQIQMIDLRDNKLYWVGKMPDGYCWMTQNLAYDLRTDTPLTPNDSDVLENWTPPYSTTHGLRKTDGSEDDWKLFDNNDNKVQSYNPGNNYLQNGVGVDTDDSRISNMGHDVSFAGNLAKNDTRWHYAQGNYYNWLAAVAESPNNVGYTVAPLAGYGDSWLDAKQSICPKGWQLPGGRYEYDSETYDYPPRTDRASYFGLIRGLFSPYKTKLIDYSGCIDKPFDTCTYRSEYAESLTRAPFYLTVAGMTQGDWQPTLTVTEPGYHFGAWVVPYGDGHNEYRYGYHLGYIGVNSDYWTSTYAQYSSYRGTTGFHVRAPYSSYTDWELYVPYSITSQGESVRCVAK